MYIIYDRDQHEVRYSDGTVVGERGFDNPFDKVFEVSSDFRPTWLVRIADMKLVPGETVTEHYWALSYSWSQSGTVVETGDGEFKRIDEAKHKIITYQKHLTTASKKEKKKSRLWRYHHRQSNMKELHLSSVVMYVKFERVVQRICKDFNIKYLWYDQMCINQDDHDAKVHEIRQMHLIYKNARCTLALVPELAVSEEYLYHANVDVIPKSEWSKRIWTLEEAYMSKSILFVGRNVHLWSKRITTLYSSKVKVFLENIKLHGNERKWMACTALWYARSRTSTKAHDRIFALVNIFPELQDRITFSYRQSLLKLMTGFYGLLAESDVSILLFGAPIDFDFDEEIKAVRVVEADLLPSWTGARGVHIPQNQFDGEIDKKASCCRLIGGSMYLSSQSILVRIESANAITRPDSISDPIVSSFYTEEGLPRRFGSERRVATIEGMWCLTFVTTTASSQEDYNHRTSVYGLQATHVLPLSEEADGTYINTLSSPRVNGGFLSLTENCSECIILSSVSFHSDTYRFHPVIRPHLGRFVSIGVCLIMKNFEMGQLENPAQDFLIV